MEIQGGRDKRRRRGRSRPVCVAVLTGKCLRRGSKGERSTWGGMMVVVLLVVVDRTSKTKGSVSVASAGKSALGAEANTNELLLVLLPPPPPPPPPTPPPLLPLREGVVAEPSTPTPTPTPPPSSSPTAALSSHPKPCISKSAFRSSFSSPSPSSPPPNINLLNTQTHTPARAGKACAKLRPSARRACVAAMSALSSLGEGRWRWVKRGWGKEERAFRAA